MGLSRTDAIETDDLFAVFKYGDSDYRVAPSSVVLDWIETNIQLPSNALGPRTINNLAISASIASSALTFSLNQGDGVNAPTTDSNSAISFETTNTDAGSFSTPEVTSRLTITIPATATLGHASNVADQIYIYAINNAGSVELAVSSENLFNEGFLWSTTAISTGATSRTTLYSNTARVGVPIRLIGKATITEAVAGTWATMPSPVVTTVDVGGGTVFAATLAASPTALTTNTPVNIASITLPPGMWDINAGFGFIPAGTTSTTDLVVGVSTTSATLPSASIIGNLPNQADISYRGRIPHISPTVWVSTSPVTGLVPEYRHIRAASGTVYLVIQATFTVSTLTGFGWLQARRVI